MFSNQILPKTCSRFYCENCHYGTSKKSSYDKHLLTVKHSVSLAGDIGDATCDIKVAKSCRLNTYVVVVDSTHTDRVYTLIKRYVYPII